MAKNIPRKHNENENPSYRNILRLSNFNVPKTGFDQGLYKAGFK